MGVFRGALLIALASAAASPHIAAQLPRAVASNQCAVCHVRLVTTTSAITHTDEWLTSTHARHGVGCEKCHGGDATRADAASAHVGVVRSDNPASPVHWMALPSTCGGCHPSELNAFALSTHDEMLREGDAMAPTCTSCHTSMAADIPSAADLERRCLQCHDRPGDDRARRARRSMDEVSGQWKTLWIARLAIAGVADERQRAALMVEWNAADGAVRAVVSAIHAFDARRVDDRLGDARARVHRLADALHIRCEEPPQTAG
ncbi:MAG TPA: multiheme c-type cytochrome [Vicinamibacterales bacterium]|nr:multiheme c-type cytochrome [Vicinamibacterales bacterium]